MRVLQTFRRRASPTEKTRARACARLRIERGRYHAKSGVATLAPMRVALLLLALAGALPIVPLLLCAGCGSTPTLPLPPPVASVGAPNAQGLVRVEGEANERAYVHVFNEQRDEGVVDRADDAGRFAIEIEASAGETLVIWQEDEGLSGERIERIVPEAAP